MKKKYIILSDRTGLRQSLINLGDRALTEGTLVLLREQMHGEIRSAGWKVFPYINISVLPKQATPEDVLKSFDRFADRILNYSNVRIAVETAIVKILNSKYVLNSPIMNAFENVFRKKYSRGLFETILPLVFRAHFARRFIEAVKAADVAVYNGAGLLSDRLRHYMVTGLFECYLAKRIGKPVISLNQTVDVSHPVARNVIKAVYSLFDMHVTREPWSSERLIELGISQEKVIASCDSAFAAPYIPHEDVAVIAEREGVEKGDIAFIIRGDRAQDLELWSRAVEEVGKRYTKQIWVLSTCIAHDNNIAQGLSGKCRFKTLSRMYDYPEMKDLMAYFDLVVTDRYHAAIFSILAHTPVVPISPQTIKIDGMFASFDYPIKPIPRLDADHYDMLMSHIDALYSDRATVRSLLHDLSNELTNKVRRDYASLYGRLRERNRAV
ncbi:MAG: polysaccharide pyruvyl transferase family protein [Candidatus Omnitrophica bacterium]|nr:polysaccharide pyruvyl transferase family protein [Candidatus Omnitrophota bacterium]